MEKGKEEREGAKRVEEMKEVSVRGMLPTEGVTEEVEKVWEVKAERAMDVQTLDLAMEKNSG